MKTDDAECQVAFGDWITVDRAAQLAGGSVRTWRWRAQREWAAARRRGRRSLAIKAPPDHGKGRHA